MIQTAKRQLDVRHLISMMAAICILVFLCVEILNQGSGKSGTVNELLTDSWDITVGGETYENVILEDFSFEMQNKGDVVTLNRTLPTVTVEDPVIVLKSVHSIVDVYLDGREIYSYGRAYADQGLMLGYGIQFVALESGYEGKELTIRFTFTEDNAINYIDAISLYNANYLYRDYIIKHQITMAFNLSLMIFGALFLLIFFIFSFRNSKYSRMVTLSIFSICIGLWSICNNNFISLFTYNLRIKAIAEFWSLYLAPLVLLLYFINDKDYFRKDWIKWLYRIALTAEAIFVVVAAILTNDAVNIIHLPQLLTTCHILMVYDLIVMMIMTISRAREEKRTNLMLIAMIILLSFGLVDIIAFNLQKYVDSFADKDFNSVSAIGLFLFAIAIMADFLVNDMESTRQKARMEVLNEFAYNDPLTGCYSRRWFEENSRNVDLSKGIGLLMYDMNHLKATNDRFGHAKGDELITTFAHILKDTFDKYGDVARVGGDEFAVLFGDVEGVNVADLVAYADRKMISASKPEEQYLVSAAHGYVDSRTLPGKNFNEIKDLADKLMYQYKEATGHGED